MTSMPPPGYENRGVWGISASAPQPPQAESSQPGPSLDPLSNRLLKLAAGLSVLLVALVTFAWLHGSSETSLNPIAEAAQRTEAMPGARMTFSAVYTSPASSIGFVMHGTGVTNGRSGLSRVEGSMMLGGRRLDIEVVGDARAMYMRGSLLTSRLPSGKHWMGIEPFLGHDPETAFAGGGEIDQRLQMLKGARSDVEEVGEEDVNGVSTTQYRGSIDLARAVSVLRREGKTEFAQVMQRLLSTQPSEIPVEVWIDDNGLVRRMRQIQTLRGDRGKPTLKMDMQINFDDFGIEPEIRIPPKSKVFDATPLVQAELGLLGKRANATVPGNHGASLGASAFRARVGKVCQDVKREFAPYEEESNALGTRVGHVIQEHGPNSSEARRGFQEMAEFFEKMLIVAEEASGRLARLAPPASLAAAYRRYLDLGQRQIDVVRAMSRALELGDYRLTDRLNTRLKGLEKSTKRLAKRLGAGACEDDQ